MIYFDADSAVGRTVEGKWVPLLWNDHEDIATDTPHQCPNSKYRQQNGGGGIGGGSQPQPKEAIPISGPKTDDWETRVGLLNGQVFARLDRIDKSIMEITKSLAMFAKYLDKNQNDADAEARYDQDKEDGLV